jgi:hypothetical protein
MDTLSAKVKSKRTKKVIMPPSVMVNQPNLRQILLDKLMKHRKTQKRVEPVIHNNNFDEQCAPTLEIKPVEVVVPLTNPSITNDKPYGVLKNGTKPTFKVWNKTQKIRESSESFPDISSEPIEILPVKIIPNESIEMNHETNHESKSEPIEVGPVDTKPMEEAKEKIKVGKNKKARTVQILIPCNHTRKVKSELQESFRKTNLTTLKNYLKQRRLIKVGTTAPTNLLRQIYENAKAYGDVVNENKQNLLYNYDNEESDKHE